MEDKLQSYINEELKHFDYDVENNKDAENIIKAALTLNYYIKDKETEELLFEIVGDLLSEDYD